MHKNSCSSSAPPQSRQGSDSIWVLIGSRCKNFFPPPQACRQDWVPGILAHRAWNAPAHSAHLRIQQDCNLVAVFIYDPVHLMAATWCFHKWVWCGMWCGCFRLGCGMWWAGAPQLMVDARLERGEEHFRILALQHAQTHTHAQTWGRFMALQIGIDPLHMYAERNFSPS